MRGSAGIRHNIAQSCQARWTRRPQALTKSGVLTFIWPAEMIFHVADVVFDDKRFPSVSLAVDERHARYRYLNSTVANRPDGGDFLAVGRPDAGSVAQQTDPHRQWSPQHAEQHVRRPQDKAAAKPRLRCTVNIQLVGNSQGTRRSRCRISPSGRPTCLCDRIWRRHAIPISGPRAHQSR